MIFNEYVNYELDSADMLSEQIKKVGKDVHDGRIRNNHYITTSKNKKLINKNGTVIEVNYTAAEQREASKKAKLRNKRNRVGIKGKPKRTASLRLRKAANIKDPRSVNNVSKHANDDKLELAKHIPVDIK